MQVKLLAVVLLSVALFAHPVAATYHATTTPGLSSDERILLLESFEEQQNGFDSMVDSRFTKHVEQLALSQRQQDERISQLESRLDIVYRFGGLIAFILTLSVPIFLYILSKSATHNKAIANSISHLAADVQVIKTVCNIRSQRMQNQQDEEEELMGCLL